MSGLSDEDAPDAELQRLVSRFLDETLTTAERDRLEERLVNEPAAQRYCANLIRFDATLQEALEPRSLEWEETRRVRFDTRKGKPFWSVQRQQTVRFGDPESPRLPGPVRKKRGWWIGGIAFLICAGGAAMLIHQQRGNTYRLRNGGFEAMDLSQSPTGVDRSVLYWQDHFSTIGTEICEAGRVSNGKFFAKSGRNAVRLRDRAFINQIILNKNGGGLKARPGLRVVVTGWSYSESQTTHSLRGSLRFVASGYPDMIQYEVANTTMNSEGPGWQPIRLEMKLPANLSVPASDTSGDKVTSPPSINVQDKELTLSLDSRSPEGVLFLDDLEIEVIPPGR